MGIAFSFSSADGAVSVVTTTASVFAPPSEEVLLSIAPVSNGAFLMKYDGSGTGGRREIGQTFQFPTSGNNPVTGFVFQIGGQSTSLGIGAYGAAFTLNIFLFDSATAVAPTGAPIYTATGLLPTVMALNDYLRFDLDQSLTLLPGQYYGVQLGFKTNASNRTIEFARALDTAYLQGRGIRADNGTTVETLDYTAATIDFKLSVLTIPEPSSMALLGFIMLGGTCLRLKSKKRLLS